MGEETVEEMGETPHWSRLPMPRGLQGPLGVNGPQHEEEGVWLEGILLVFPPLPSAANMEKGASVQP